MISAVTVIFGTAERIRSMRNGIPADEGGAGEIVKADDLRAEDLGAEGWLRPRCQFRP
jgi:hypothetical protein